MNTYATREERKAAEQRALLEGANYIVEYKDAREGQEFGLNSAVVSWVPDGYVWIDPEPGAGGQYHTRQSLVFSGVS